MEKPTALIVEDDRDILALFRHVMDLAGYKTEIVLHGQIALEHLAVSVPDIVLLDLNLPGVSGSEILTRMYADERLRNVPVVVITAVPQLLKNTLIKPQLVLTKPVDIEQMSALIQQICPPEHSLESLPWDGVTGLYNRTFFVSRLKYALDQTRQARQSQFAVLYLDLQRSAKLDYLFGSQHNDKVLKETAVLLKSTLRPIDTLAHFSGGLFAILLEDIRDHEMPIVIAGRIQNKIRKYLSKLESELQVRANVGIVLCGEEYHSVEQILQEAEQALALAKSDRKKMLQMLRSRAFDVTREMELINPVMR